MSPSFYLDTPSCLSLCDKPEYSSGFSRGVAPGSRGQWWSRRGAAFLTRPKRGFEIPLNSWLRREVRGWVRDVLLSSRALGRGIFRPAAIQRLVDEHQSGCQNLGHILWALLFLEQRFVLYADGGGPLPAPLPSSFGPSGDAEREGVRAR